MTQNILNRSFHDLEFTHGMATGLEHIGIKTIYELTMCTEKRLLRIPGWGPDAVARVRARLALFGLELLEPLAVPTPVDESLSKLEHPPKQ